MNDQKSNESNIAAGNEPANPTKSRLRGAVLQGADQKTAADHTDYEKSRNPDSELHLDQEDDSLYADGLDVGDDDEPLAGTDGNSPKGVKG
jgi:hypothetical protein